MRLVQIDWLDAYSEDEWVMLADLKIDESRAVTKSVGWLVHDGDIFKVVAGDLDHDRCGRVMFIPTSCVRRIADLNPERTAVRPEDEH